MAERQRGWVAALSFRLLGRREEEELVAGEQQPVPVPAVLGPFAWASAQSSAITLSFNIFSTGDPPDDPSFTPRNRMIARNRRRAEEIRGRIARRKAEALFRAHLSDEQQATWRKHGSITVRSPSGRTWQIRRGWEGNITLAAGPPAELGEPGRRYRTVQVGAGICVAINRWEIVPSQGFSYDRELPMADNLLAQKLILEAPGGEELLLRVAR